MCLIRADNNLLNTSASEFPCVFHRSANLPFFVFGCPLGAGEDAGDVAAVSSGADDRDAARAVRLRRDICCGQLQHRSKYREKNYRLPLWRRLEFRTSEGGRCVYADHVGDIWVEMMLTCAMYQKNCDNAPAVPSRRLGDPDPDIQNRFRAAWSLLEATHGIWRQNCSCSSAQNRYTTISLPRRQIQ